MRKSGRTNAWVQESFMKYWSTKNSKVAWRIRFGWVFLATPMWRGLQSINIICLKSSWSRTVLWKIVTLRLISKVASSLLRHLYIRLRAWGYWRIRFGGQITNWIQGNLFPFELEIEYENNVETDWNSPPIYDEYLDVEAFDPTKENIGESLHHKNLDYSCQNGST